MTDHQSDAQRRGSSGRLGRALGRFSDETKASYKTSELAVYVLAVLGVLIASAVVGDGDSGAYDGDVFAADKAWLMITALTIGYMLSRGLAKSGAPHDGRVIVDDSE